MKWKDLPDNSERIPNIRIEKPWGHHSYLSMHLRPIWGLNLGQETMLNDRHNPNWIRELPAFLQIGQDFLLSSDSIMWLLPEPEGEKWEGWSIQLRECSMSSFYSPGSGLAMDCQKQTQQQWRWIPNISYLLLALAWVPGGSSFLMTFRLLAVLQLLCLEALQAIT